MNDNLEPMISKSNNSFRRQKRRYYYIRQWTSCYTYIIILVMILVSVPRLQLNERINVTKNNTCSGPVFTVRDEYFEKWISFQEKSINIEHLIKWDKYVHFTFDFLLYYN